MSNVLLYGGFIVFVLTMLLLDLKVFHSEAKTPTTKASASWVAVWVGLAVVFGVILYFWKGGTSAGLYFTGYLIEYSLSVDNMFVFIVIFTYFRVPPAYQHQVLFYGILGAIIFRGIFIALGVTLIQSFSWVLYVFGALLIFTAYRIAKGTEDVEPEDNPVLKIFRRYFRTTTKYYGQKLFTVENGKRLATPLFVVLLIIETTDIFFAIDSIPAILGIFPNPRDPDPFIVLTSNVFAILGLRALYFLLAGSMSKFHLLKYGLSIILGFVGVKMILAGFPHESRFHFEIPIYASLGFIIGVLAITVIASLKFPPSVTEEHLPAPDPTITPPE
ncbi:MAG TPA: TerC family protein [Actinomycetota bacterium]|nr:TerC family protein [Actinomycetota bacterium]